MECHGHAVACYEVEGVWRGVRVCARRLTWTGSMSECECECKCECECEAGHLDRLNDGKGEAVCQRRGTRAVHHVRRTL